MHWPNLYKGGTISTLYLIFDDANQCTRTVVCVRTDCSFILMPTLCRANQKQTLKQRKRLETSRNTYPIG
ncbi:hypothetical protein BLOT_011034 [Blomia tropicalis]|nr:hypothetical protein BLOT_011034 [Blomia tropicalis]